MSFPDLSPAMQDVIAERRRQIEREGFDETHDQAHRNGELLRAALAYGTRCAVWLQMRGHGVPEERIAAEAERAGVPSVWPWEREWWKPHPLRRCLVIVAALVIAQVDRLDREEAQS